MTSLPSLLPEQFAEFFDALHRDPAAKSPRITPFPWQSRLSARIASGGEWPTWLALPTATGKTCAIDIAIFALAVQADQTSVRRAPRRVFFVVDRRVVVDEAAERAQRIATRLQWAAQTEDAPAVLRSAALRLRFLAQGGQGVSDGPADSVPLAVATLRGGIFRDDCWLRSPLQPAVIASTVDQLGSRLLFRGYGASPGQWPIHAGLCGNDALIILDEAHCANPFLQTLQAIARYRSAEWAAQPLPLPFAYTVMTATPPAGVGDDTLSLEEDDRSHPILSQRLRAAKPATLEIGARTTTQKGLEEFAERLADQAIKFSESPSGHRAVGVIVNRVLAARLIYKAVLSRLSSRSVDDRVSVVLLTGRMRPVDRDVAVANLKSIHTAKRRTPDDAAIPLEKPTIVIATQTLEVGADLDFDDLIAECASLDALRQRFGRLNRSGRPITSRALVVVRKEQAKADADDPIYGQALGQTWTWLSSVAKDSNSVDFGIESMAALLSASPSNDLQLVLPNAPVVLPAYLDCWVQTSPTPAVDPDVDVFLHGVSRGVPQVQICWRADLPDAVPGSSESAIETVAICPPSARECMPVPLTAARRWLRGLRDPGLESDVEGVSGLAEEEPDQAPSEVDRWALVFRRSGRRNDGSFVVTSGQPENSIAELKPGDTLVIPAGLKGWDELGHLASPLLTSAAIDCAEAVHLTMRCLAVIRINKSAIEGWPEGPTREAAGRLLEHVAGVTDPDRGEIEVFLKRAVEDATDRFRNAAARHLLRRNSRREVKRHPYGGLVIFSRRRVAKDTVRALLTGAFDDVALLFAESDDSASATVNVKLWEHIDGVQRWTRDFAVGSGLDESMVEGLTRSADLHDLGKADPRFQAWLRGGNQWLASGKELLGKSEGLPKSSGERNRTRELAGYPKGGRHELLSVRLIESDAVLLRDVDADLVPHLIATHHGWCRPFAPVIDDRIGVDDRRRRVRITLRDGRSLHADVVTGLEALDSGIAERFWKVVRRFGWWGAAYLEAVLRLADARRSEEEELLASDHQGTEDAAW